MTTLTTLTFNTVKSSPITYNGYVFVPTSPATNTLTNNDGMTSTGNNTWLGNNQIVSAQFPTTLTTIGNNAFASANRFTTVSFDSPSSLTTIGFAAFSSTPLSSIIIPNLVVELSSSIFDTCVLLSSVTFETPSSVASIASYAFYNCSELQNLTLNTPLLTTIYALAFAVTGLRQITISNSVTSIEGSAFDRSTNLIWVENSSPTLTLGTAVFPIAFNNASKTLFTSSSSNPIYSYIQTNYPLTTIVVGPSCYNENVNILTDNGYIPINQIQIGASIKTLNDGYKKVIKTHFQPFNANHSHFGSTMYKLKLDNEFKELNITGNHCILLDEYDNHMDATVNGNKDEWMIDGKHISVAGKNPNFEKMPETSYMVYHLVLENDDAKRRYAIFANGILSESMSEGHYDEIRCLV